jgi:hypothetical protein
MARNQKKHKTSSKAVVPKQFKLYVRGKRYEVSGSLLDKFPGSMLRRIISETWNEDNDSSGLDQNKEIFIDETVEGSSLS